MRLKISEDKLAEMQAEVDEANDKLSHYKVEMDKLFAETRKTKYLSEEVESSNRISEINLKSLLKNLQDKEQLAMTLKDQLVKEQFRNELLVTELKTLKENHRTGSIERSMKNSTAALDEVLK